MLHLEFGDGGDRRGRIDADRGRERRRVHHIQTGTAVHFAEGVGHAVLAAVTHGATALVVYGQPFPQHAPHWIGAELAVPRTAGNDAEHALLHHARRVEEPMREPRPEPPLLVMRVFDNPEAAAIEVAPLHENDARVSLGFPIAQRP